MQCPRVIIPAAGFGRRVGSPEAKELLCLRQGQPLIQQALDFSLARQWPVTVVTRPEKVSLIEYLESRPQVIDVILTEATTEWPSSVLKSAPHWHEWNLLVLPDTHYLPLNIWDMMWQKAESERQLVVAHHQVDDLSLWGVIEPTEAGVKVFEKCKAKKPGCAWGLLLFHKKVGEALFAAHLTSRELQVGVDIQPCYSEFIDLIEFQDLTRA